MQDKEKVIYWPQYAEGFYKPVDNPNTPEIPKDNRFKIIFTGNVGYAQGLDILPKVAKLIENVLFVIVGDGRFKEQLIKETEEVKNKFLFIDRQPSEKIPEILCACDAAFISFMDNPLFEKTIPAKLQSYMACGMPILASASGETKRIIEESNCGICCVLGNVQELSEAIIELKKANLKIMKNASLNYSNKNFNCTELFNKIEEEMNLSEETN